MLIDVHVPLHAEDRVYIFGDTALHSACRTGHSALVQAMLRNSNDVNVRNSRGETPLFVVATKL